MASPDVSQPKIRGASERVLAWTRIRREFVVLAAEHGPEEGRPNFLAAAALLSYFMSTFEYHKSSDWTGSFTRRDLEDQYGMKRRTQESARKLLRSIVDPKGRPLITESAAHDDTGGRIHYRVDPAVYLPLKRDIQIRYGLKPDDDGEVFEPLAPTPQHSDTPTLRDQAIADLRAADVSDKRAKQLVGKHGPEHCLSRLALYKTLPQWIDTKSYFRTHGGSRSSQLIACIEDAREWNVPESVQVKAVDDRQSAELAAATNDEIADRESADLDEAANWLVHQSRDLQDQVRKEALATLPKALQKRVLLGDGRAKDVYEKSINLTALRFMRDRAPP